MAVYTLAARKTASTLFKQATWTLALGVGDATWDDAPEAPVPAATDLVEKVGLTLPRDIQFVTPDEANGTITMQDGSKWSISAEATRYLYFEFKLDHTDADGFTLREAGLFQGAEIDAAVPGGQTYVADAQVVSYGTLCLLDRFNSIVRDGTLEQSFTFILTL